MIIKAECRKHGIQELEYDLQLNAYFCPVCNEKFPHPECRYSVTNEEMKSNPDGGILTRKCSCKALDEMADAVEEIFDK